MKFVATWESFLPCPYQDTGGVWTIGYGHTEGVGPLTPCIKEGAARRLLRRDLRIAQRAVKSLVKVPLSRNQYAALCSFVFNVGPGNFEKSTLLALLNKGMYATASLEFGKWVYDSAGNRLLGLERRRKSERHLFNAR